MAIVKNKGNVSVKGKVGSSVFFSSAGQSVIRTASSKYKTSTPAQLAQRGFFQDAKDAWKILTYDMVCQWRSWASQANWKKGTYQYFIHCYMKDLGPMPVDYKHLILKRKITVAELSSIGSSPVLLIPSPGVGKFIFCRNIQWFCSIANYDPSMELAVSFFERSGYDYMFQLFGNVSKCAFGHFVFIDDFNSHSDFSNLPLFLFGQNCNDLGCSTDLFLQIEYSIFDYYKS